MAAGVAASCATSSSATSADLRARRIVRDGFIDRLLHLHGADDARYYGVFIWVLAMLEQWFKAHEIPA